MTDLSLPPPYRLLRIPRSSGLVQWRPGQERAILSVTDDDTHRIFPMVQSTGFGKSAGYMAIHRLMRALTGKRTLILTATKALEAQLMAEFRLMGLTDVQGKANYPCVVENPITVDEFRALPFAQRGVSVEDGPCHVGTHCEHKVKGGCHFFDAVSASQRSELVVTNYPWWLSSLRSSNPLGEFGLLICDEAHHAPDEIASHLSFTFTAQHAKFLMGRWPPDHDWTFWCGEMAKYTRREYESIALGQYGKDHGARSRRRVASSLLRALDVLSTADESQWVREDHYPKSRDYRRIRFDPVWPAPYAESHLFRQIPKVVLVSATLRPKTLDLLGIKRTAYAFREYPSPFPVERRRVTYIPTARLFGAPSRYNPAAERIWLARIDQIISRRLDRKGIIFTHSYKRRDYILDRSTHRARFITHEEGSASLLEALERFRAAPPGTVFLSPAATTGIDLKYQDSEYGIMAKVPFPDTRSKILKARQKVDRTYGCYLAMIDIVQAAGRGMRAHDDQFEFFIIDDHWTWFRRKFKSFAPRYFLEACRMKLSVPDPPPPLKRRVT